MLKIVDKIVIKDIENEYIFLKRGQNPDDKILFVSFGSKGGKFNFTNILKKYNALFLRCDDDSWYHNLKGIAEDVTGVVSIINKIKCDHGFEKIIVVGSSMGGYGSLLYGSLLNADKIFTINPLIDLSENAKVWKDKASKFREYAQEYNIKNPYYELQKLYENRDCSNVTYIVGSFYHDNCNVSIFSEMKNINIIRYSNDNHNNLPMELKQNGELDQYMEKLHKECQ